MENYYKVTSTPTTNYKKILDDYRRNFAGRQVELTTNYEPLKKFTVVFNELDLPHLMGWEKVIDKSGYAKRIILLIDNHKFTFENSRKHRCFKEIKSRLLNYNFLHEVFWENDPSVCIMTADMKPNPLRLDIVFLKKINPREIIVLGLRRKNTMESFVPTTLHTETAHNNDYLRRRRTNIKSINWKPTRI